MMNTRRSILGWLACAVVTGGCNLAPNYVRPDLSPQAPSSSKGTANGPASGVPAQFKEGSSAGWKAAAPNDDHLGGNWWELFGDSDLTALEQRVGVSNQNIALAEANYRQARALVAEARASLFPTITASPAITRYRNSASNANSGASGSSSGSGAAPTSGPAGQTNTQYTAPVDASYQLDLWGRIRNTIAQNSDLAQASAADVATAVLSTQAELAQDYYQLRAADEQRHILGTTLADYQASLHLVNTLFKSGLASEEDLSEADTALASAQAQATDLGIARAQFEHAIAVLLGLPPARFSLPVKRFSPVLPAIPVALPSEILERRPDIAAAERRVAAANAGIGIARAAYFPTVTLSGAFGFEASNAAQWFDWPNRFWSVGPSLAQTLFAGGLLRGENAAARAVYDEGVATYRQTVLSAFQSVEDDLVTLRILSKEVSQQHWAAESARRTVELSVTRFRAGIDSYVNVITAQNTFLTNRLAELQVQVRQLTTAVSLVNNLGGGWDASQTDATARMAVNPQEPTGLAPGESSEAVPNPPPLSGPPPKPEELLQQDEQDMAPSAPSPSAK
jgi:NodT family efflux transporter outer membrane factor (OMF) lipoprotein